MKTLKVLSYNVSWGCSSIPPDTGDASAVEIAKKCKDVYGKNPPGVTKCSDNMAKVIDQGGPYDLIGLQEYPLSPRSGSGIVSKSQILTQMGLINHYVSERVQLNTFYNSRKLIPLYAKVGDILPGNGRPYHILFFGHKTKKGPIIIFINLHNANRRGYGKQKLSEIFSKNINLVIDLKSTPKDDYLKLDSRNETEDISDFLLNEEFEIIVVGDFNDTRGSNFWEGFNPFKRTPFIKIDKMVKNKNPPPRTCCVGRSSIRQRENEDSNFGDYILVSDGIIEREGSIIPLHPKQYDATKFPTSDHLPISSELELDFSGARDKAPPTAPYHPSASASASKPASKPPSTPPSKPPSTPYRPSASASKPPSTPYRPSASTPPSKPPSKPPKFPVYRRPSPSMEGPSIGNIPDHIPPGFKIFMPGQGQGGGNKLYKKKSKRKSVKTKSKRKSKRKNKKLNKQ
jgi:hypothetical protein